MLSGRDVRFRSAKAGCDYKDLYNKKTHVNIPVDKPKFAYCDNRDVKELPTFTDVVATVGEDPNSRSKYDFWLGADVRRQKHENAESVVSVAQPLGESEQHRPACELLLAAYRRRYNS